MNIEEVRKYAEENGMSEKKVALLVAELHPDESGKLSIEESSQAILAINYHAETKEFVKYCLEQVKRMRTERKKTDK